MSSSRSMTTGRVRSLYLSSIVLGIAILACSRAATGVTWIDNNFNRMFSPLRVEITGPADNSTFLEGDMIRFEGQYHEATDCKEANWSSSLDGQISQFPSGPCDLSMNLTTSKLSVGKHTITYRVKDKDGPSSETITITVLPKGSDLPENESSQPGQVQLMVSTDQDGTLDELIANRVAARIAGDCPPVDDEHAWATEDRQCQWPVYHDIDTFTFDLGFVPDESDPNVEITLEGSLILQKLYSAGEYGIGDISAGGPLKEIHFTESSPGVYKFEGVLPLEIKAEGEYVQLHTSDGYSVVVPGGVDLSIDTHILVDTVRRRIEIRYEGHPLTLSTGTGDGHIVEALEVDLAFTWTEGLIEMP